MILKINKIISLSPCRLVWPISVKLNTYSRHARRSVMFQRSLKALRTQLIKAQAMADEANLLSTEMKRDTRFTVTLHIPARNLTPYRRVSTHLLADCCFSIIISITTETCCCCCCYYCCCCAGGSVGRYQEVDQLHPGYARTHAISLNFCLVSK